MAQKSTLSFSAIMGRLRTILAKTAAPVVGSLPSVSFGATITDQHDLSAPIYDQHDIGAGLE